MHWKAKAPVAPTLRTPLMGLGSLLLFCVTCYCLLMLLYGCRCIDMNLDVMCCILNSDCDPTCTGIGSNISH